MNAVEGKKDCFIIGIKIVRIIIITFTKKKQNIGRLSIYRVNRSSTKQQRNYEWRYSHRTGIDWLRKWCLLFIIFMFMIIGIHYKAGRLHATFMQLVRWNNGSLTPKRWRPKIARLHSTFHLAFWGYFICIVAECWCCWSSCLATWTNDHRLECWRKQSSDSCELRANPWDNAVACIVCYCPA